MCPMNTTEKGAKTKLFGNFSDVQKKRRNPYFCSVSKIFKIPGLLISSSGAPYQPSGSTKRGPLSSHQDIYICDDRGGLSFTCCEFRLVAVTTWLFWDGDMVTHNDLIEENGMSGSSFCAIDSQGCGFQNLTPVSKLSQHHKHPWRTFSTLLRNTRRTNTWNARLVDPNP